MIHSMPQPGRLLRFDARWLLPNPSSAVFGPGPSGALRLLLLTSICALAPGASAQTLQQKLLAPDAGQADEFGNRVALIPGWAFCAAHYDDDVQSQSGAVYVFKETGSSWSFHQKLKASDPTFGGTLGESLAAWGDWMVAGTPQDDPQGYSSRGSVHVYNMQGDTWVHTQKILASDFQSSTQEYFGTAASLRGDLMVIGEDDDSTKAYHSGSAYVFGQSGSTWIEIAKLYASDWEEGAGFGRAVAVDGETLVVGASQEDNGSVVFPNQGAAYVFERTGGSWAETQKLVASDPKKGDSFGISVAIDGDTIVVGAALHNHSVIAEGAMYVFERQGGSWVQTQELLGSDPADSPWMGAAVALEGDHALGSAHADDDVANNGGSARLFRRDENGSWLQVAKFLPFDGAPSDIFSNSVAISGTRVLCGARGDDEACPTLPGCNSGSAYVFDFAPAAVQYGSCPSQGPCGNHDDFGGCRTSSGYGGVLNAAGSASVVADDLRFEARWLPANKLGLFFMGGLATAVPFGDGQLCVASGGMGIWRFNPPQSSGASGVLNLGPGVAGLSQILPPGGHIGPGQTWHFQAWFRDPAGPCGKGSNMTNGLRMTFEP